MGWNLLADLPSFLQPHDDELTAWAVRVSIDLFLSLLFYSGGLFIFISVDGFFSRIFDSPVFHFPGLSIVVCWYPSLMGYEDD
jgi:hypothetical protein